MIPHDYDEQLRRRLQQHRSEAPADLVESAIARARTRRTRHQLAAGGLALVTLAGVGLGAAKLGAPPETDTAAGPIATNTATPEHAMSSPAPVTCTETNAQWSLAKGGTVDGVQTFKVRVRPMAANCTVSGIPGFWLVDDGNEIIGSPAVHVGATGAPVVVTAQQSASATVRYDATLTTSARCQKVPGGQVRFFTPGGSIPMGSPTTLTGCRNASVKLFTVSTFVAD